MSLGEIPQVRSWSNKLRGTLEAGCAPGDVEVGESTPMSIAHLDKLASM